MPKEQRSNMLHTGGSCGAAALPFITSSVSTYVYLCTLMYVNNSALHLHWLLGFLGIYFFSISFLKQSKSRVWLHAALLQKNAQVKERL